MLRSVSLSAASRPRSHTQEEYNLQMQMDGNDDDDSYYDDCEDDNDDGDNTHAFYTNLIL